MLQNAQWTKKKVALVAALWGLGALSVGAGLYVWWLWTPPPLPRTPEQAVAVIGSARYEALPEYRQREYLVAASKTMEGMTDEQRRAFWEEHREDEASRAAMREVRMNRMRERVMAFAEASPEEKVAILDAQIDEWEARRAEWRERRQQREAGEGRGNGGGGRAGGDGGEGGRSDEDREARRASRQERFRNRLEERFETGNPQENALIGEYFRALRARREARGLGDGRGGRGRG